MAVSLSQRVASCLELQGLEPDEEEDPDAYLMECWPDDPADIGLESVLKTVGPLFEQRLYPDGSKLARQGDPAHCIYFIEEGNVMVLHTNLPQEADEESSDEDDEDEVLSQILKSMSILSSSRIGNKSGRLS